MKRLACLLLGCGLLFDARAEVFLGPTSSTDRLLIGTNEASYVHGPRVDEILFRADASGTVYHHHDALGSVTHLTDAAGTVVESYRYDIFGKATITGAQGGGVPVSQVGNRFQFTGREYLAAFGLHDYRNRVYSEALGRFVQTDPIRFEAEDENLYRYCRNGPVNAVDPDGLMNMVSAVTTTGAIGALMSRMDPRMLQRGISGVYEFTVNGKHYVGQSADILRRMAEHSLRFGKNAISNFRIVRVQGGKVEREIVEFRRIREITDGRRVRQAADIMINKVDPIGEARQDKLGLR